MIEVIPTCVPADAESLARWVEKARTYTSSVHLDIDDGVFAPHLTWPYTMPGAYAPFDLSALADMNVEAHLMVKEPREVGSAFARAGAFRLIAHLESFGSAEEIPAVAEEWRSAGATEIGLALLMDTPLESAEPLMQDIDFAHLMSIPRVGTQGIPFSADATARVATFHSTFPSTLISVDGGVSEHNIGDLVRAGARRFGVGSAIEKSENPAESYQRILSAAESALQ
jgi:ribulose-phosphate 3-epimerase